MWSNIKQDEGGSVIGEWGRGGHFSVLQSSDQAPAPTLLIADSEPGLE